MEELIPIDALFTNAAEGDSETALKAKEFQKQLFSLENCLACGLPFEIGSRVCRLLPQCGHGLCGVCIEPLLQYQILRCPICMKGLKDVSSIDRLPVHGLAFSHLFVKEKLDRLLLPEKDEGDNKLKPFAQ